MSDQQTNVLLVEDDPATRNLVERMLCKSPQVLDCNLQTATTLSNAVEKMSHSRFDNVLLDLGLPDSRGIETFSKMQKANSEVSIVVLTASNDEQMELRARRQGADDYIVKGTEAWGSLASHIKYAIERKKMVDAIKNDFTHFKTVFEKAPVSIICISPAGRIRDFNENAERMWNVKKNQALGKSFLNTCIPAGDRFRLYGDLTKVLNGQKIKPVETSIDCPEGTSEMVFWNFERITDDKNATAGVVAAAHNISREILDANKALLAPKLVFNPKFDETVDTILASLSVIAEKIYTIKEIAGEKSLKKLADENPYSEYDMQELSPKKAAAIEKLILSLISSGEETALE